MHICVSFSRHIYIYMSTYIHVYLSVYIHVYQTTYMHVYLSKCLCVCLSTCFRMHLRMLTERRKMERKAEGDTRRKMWTERFGNGSTASKDTPSSGERGRWPSAPFLLRSLAVVPRCLCCVLFLFSPQNQNKTTNGSSICACLLIKDFCCG